MISADSVPWMIIAGMGGIIVAMLAHWGMQQVERINGTETKIERSSERQHDLDRNQVAQLAKLEAEVARLKEDAKRCEELAERAARLEAFQSWAEPLLERAVDGLQRIAAFEAKLDAELKTLFKGMGAITLRMEKMLLAQEPPAPTRQAQALSPR